MVTPVAAGDKAPDFRVASDDGGTLTRADFAGRNLVIFFYPKANTSGCTLESKAFSALAKAFAKADTAVIGVSADSPAAQANFRKKQRLTVPLGCDESHAMLKAYGVWGEKSLYGRKYMGITRTTVLIGRDGRIARIWPKVKVAGHAEEVLAAAQAL